LVTPDDTCIGRAAVEFAASQSEFTGLLIPPQPADHAAQHRKPTPFKENVCQASASPSFPQGMVFMCAISDIFVQKIHIYVVIKAKNQ
jgi:hypothetical protein